MSNIPDHKIVEMTKQINDARERFKQVVAERDALAAQRSECERQYQAQQRRAERAEADLAAARALLGDIRIGVCRPWADPLMQRIDAALGKDAK
jgi:chromosome segregation ATPase